MWPSASSPSPARVCRGLAPFLSKSGSLPAGSSVTPSWPGSVCLALCFSDSVCPVSVSPSPCSCFSVQSPCLLSPCPLPLPSSSLHLSPPEAQPPLTCEHHSPVCQEHLNRRLPLSQPAASTVASPARSKLPPAAPGPRPNAGVSSGSVGVGARRGNWKPFPQHLAGLLSPLPPPPWPTPTVWAGRPWKPLLQPSQPPKGS